MDTTVTAYDLAGVCSCPASCVFDGLEELSRSFRRITELERTTTVKEIILALTSLPDHSNKLMQFTSSSTSSDSTDVSYCRSHTQYDFRGRPVCRDVFSEVTNVSIGTLKRLVIEGSSIDALVCHSAYRGLNRKGALSTQSIIGSAFLR